MQLQVGLVIRVRVRVSISERIMGWLGGRLSRGQADCRHEICLLDVPFGEHHMPPMPTDIGCGSFINKCAVLYNILLFELALTQLEPAAAVWQSADIVTVGGNSQIALEGKTHYQKVGLVLAEVDNGVAHMLVITVAVAFN